MREIRLYGSLGRRFGRVFRFDVASPAEAVRALAVQLEGFRAYLLTHNEPGYKIFVGQRNVGKEALNTHSAGSVIKMVPVIAGAGRGFWNVVLGGSLIALAFFNPFGLPAWLLGGMKAVGTSLTLSGVSQMLFRPPPLEVKNRPENQPSYAFDGPINTVAQGHCVPVLYGGRIAGWLAGDRRGAVDRRDRDLNLSRCGGVTRHRQSRHNIVQDLTADPLFGNFEIVAQLEVQP